jgi:hypothetical protein
MMGRLRRLARLPAEDRRALLEAAVLLGVAQVVVRLGRFRAVVPHLGVCRRETARALAPGARAHVRRVGWSVDAVSRRVPWRATCLTKAMAAKLMLRRRGVPSTLYFGVRQQDGHGIAAHAWLRAGDTIVTGARAIREFTPVATFA